MNTNSELCKRVIAVLLFCQANKGDLSVLDCWEDQGDALKKMFFIYYSGLWCRVLYMMYGSDLTGSFIQDCENLLDKYNWYDIQEKDLDKFCTNSYDCEIPDALEYIDGLDNVVWNGSGFSRSVCVKLENSCWDFSDVRGSACRIRNIK